MGGQNPYQAAARQSDNNNSGNNENTSSDTAPNPWAANVTNNSNNNSSNNNQDLPQMSQGLQDAMRNHISQNPQLLGQMFGGQLGDMASSNPEAASRIGQLLTNPGLMGAMQKPEVQAAMRKIQEGFAVINREAPELARAMGMPDLSSFGAGFGGLGGASPAAATAAPTPS